jgi:hypothetical protein
VAQHQQFGVLGQVFPHQDSDQAEQPAQELIKDRQQSHPAIIHDPTGTPGAQVILEGVGPVKGCLWSFVFFSAWLWARRAEVSGSRLGRSPTAKRPEGLEAGVGRCTLWVVEKDYWVVAPGGRVWGRGAHQGRVSG